VRLASVEEMRRLGLPQPPPHFPLVWEPGDEVELRPTAEIEARAAILHVVLARCFGMPPQAAMSWLLGSHLVDQVTPPEWQFVMGGRGDHRSFVLHHDAVYALAWLLGLSKHLDPEQPPRARPSTPPPCSTSITASTGDTWRPSGPACRCPARSTPTRSASGGGPWSGR
jgi:hypothetical protein